MRRWHDLEVHYTDPDNIIEATYLASLFERSSREYYRLRSELTLAECALDVRRPLSQSRFLGPLASAINGELRRLGIRQVAGMGYGSFALIGGLVATSRDLKSVLIRTEAKRYGFREMLEGEIEPDLPVAIIDDILSTGKSALKAATVLRDHAMHPTVLLTVFRLSWRGGRDLLRYHGIESQSLASLSLTNSRR